MPLSITPGRWYARQMLPGYVGERCVPYHRPIQQLFLHLMASRSEYGVEQESDVQQSLDTGFKS